MSVGNEGKGLRMETNLENVSNIILSYASFSFFHIFLYAVVRLMLVFIFSILLVKDEKLEDKRTPSDFLKSVIGRPATVKLNSGIEYRGVLACLDGYLNIAMEQTQEFGLDGQLKATYGDCFIRGNNVLHISSQ